MIDVETLATNRATALSQPVKDWVAVTHRSFFMRVCAALSDGEIHQIFAISDGPDILAALADGLATGIKAGETMAFDKWKNAFAASNIELHHAARLWAEAWPKYKKFAKCLAAIAVPNEISQRKRG
jgi:hypothetical protein